MEEIIAKYLNAKKIERNITFEAIAAESGIPESTVKNLLAGNTDPRMSTIVPVMKAVGGSFDEMLYPERVRSSPKEDLLALKDMYEFQIATIRETNEKHIHNIRAHYEQHHEDLKDNYEHRIADKGELIESQKEHITSLKKECRASKIAFGICVAVFIAVLIAEVMNPNLGWVRY